MDFGSVNYFGYQVTHLRRIGIVLTPEKKFVVTYLSYILGAALFIISMGLSYGVYESVGFLEKQSEMLTPYIISSLCTTKHLTFIFRRSSFEELLKKLLSMTQKAKGMELQALINENKKHTKLCKLYETTHCLSGTSAAMMPLIVMATQYIRTGHVEYTLPFDGNYLLDITKFPSFCIILLWLSLAIYVVTFTTLSFDLLFYFYIHNIVGHFHVIQEKLKVILTSEEENATKLEQAIRSVIVHHQTTIEMAEEIDRLYRPIVFAQFSLSAIQLCVVAFQLIQGVEWAHAPFLTMFFISVLLQMIIFCYGGQRLETESTEIATKFYEAIQWTRGETKLKKLFFLPMLRAQKPCIITGIFFKVNMELFVTVVKTAGSYVTLMRTLEDES